MAKNEGLLSVADAVLALRQLPSDVVEAARQAFLFQKYDAFTAALGDQETATVATSLMHHFNGHYEYVLMCMAEPWNVSAIGPEKIQYMSARHLSKGR